MKIRRTTPVTLSILVAAAVAASSPPLTAQEPPQGADMEAMMAAYKKLAEPGAEHRRLATLAGTWNQDITINVFPGQPPQKLTGSAHNEMILGGRFLKSETSGGEGDFAMEGLTILGFDTRTQEYTLVGYDTWGTYYITAAGTYDPETETMTLSGETLEAMGDGTELYDITLKWKSDEEYLSEIIFKMPGGERFTAVSVVNRRAD